MFRKNSTNNTTLKVNDSYLGERIEEKIDRIVNNKEPIKDGAPLIYTERKDGVRPEFDIKTDRWEVAIDAMGYVDKSHKASRMQRIGEKTYDTMTAEEQGQFNKKYPNNKHNIMRKSEGTSDSRNDTTSTSGT